MNADTLQQHEDHGRRWATALLAIGERPGQVKADAIRKSEIVHVSVEAYRWMTSEGWREAAVRQNRWRAEYAFLAGAFAACEESTR